MTRRRFAPRAEYVTVSSITPRSGQASISLITRLLSGRSGMGRPV